MAQSQAHLISTFAGSFARLLVLPVTPYRNRRYLFERTFHR